MKTAIISEVFWLVFFFPPRFFCGEDLCICDIYGQHLRSIFLGELTKSNDTFLTHPASHLQLVLIRHAVETHSKTAI